MTTVDDMIDRLAAFDPTEAAAAIMESTSEQVLDLNRSQMYEKGVDALGNPLPLYSLGSLRSGYVERKNNPRFLSGNDSYDGKDTGATYESMMLEITGKDYAIVPGTDYAEETLGPDAFGLTKDSKEKYWEETLHDGMVYALAETLECTVTA